MKTHGKSKHSFLLTHLCPGNFEQDSHSGRSLPNASLPETYFEF